MVVVFGSSQLKRYYSDSTYAQRKLGARRSALYIRRINEMIAAESLEDLRKLPGARCHALKRDRNGTFAVDLEHPYRLVFEPLDSDETGDLSKVTSVRIFEVVDYHD